MAKKGRKSNSKISNSPNVASTLDICHENKLKKFSSNKEQIDKYIKEYKTLINKIEKIQKNIEKVKKQEINEEYQITMNNL
jgi:predicted ribosome quality control (RQC) complex YloA/Tae2 family protein